MINLLPIGSVVRLKSGDKKLMIYGRIQYNSDLDNTFDYLSCYYPEGSIGDEYNFLFNHEDIEEVCFVGFVNEEEQSMMIELNKFLENNRGK